MLEFWYHYKVKLSSKRCHRLYIYLYFFLNWPKVVTYQYTITQLVHMRELFIRWISV